MRVSVCVRVCLRVCVPLPFTLPYVHGHGEVRKKDGTGVRRDQRAAHADDSSRRQGSRREQRAVVDVVVGPARGRGWGGCDRKETVVAAASAGMDETGLFGLQGGYGGERGRQKRKTVRGGKKRFPIKSKKKKKSALVVVEVSGK